MKLTNLIRLHWAALRLLLVLTLITGIGYPLFIWLVAQLPVLKGKAAGSIIEVDHKPVASRLIGQDFTDGSGHPLTRYFQSRPSAAGSGYDPLATGASNLGPESVVDEPGTPSLLTLVCSRSKAIGRLEGVDGSRPFCTGDGVGAVLSVIGSRDAVGNVVHPAEVVSLNESCTTTTRPFIAAFQGVPVRCAEPGKSYAAGQLVPIRGAAPDSPVVPADAVTASASGLDPDISQAYAQLQVRRVARVRGVSADTIRQLVSAHTAGRSLGVLGEPSVNVVELNLDLDMRFPVPGGGS